MILWRRFAGLAETWYSIDAYLGHGRLLESGLVFLKFQYGLLFLVLPADEILLRALEDMHYPWLVGVPFLICSITSLVGLVLNARGHEQSRWYRVIGASIGMAVWIFLLSKDLLIGAWGAAMNPIALFGIVASILIIRRGMMGLPRPGSAGQV